MGLHTDGVLVLFFVGCVMMNMRVVINQIHTLRHIEELQVRSVVCQLVSPSLLKTDIADAEVSLTACKLYELLRRRVIGFRTCALGNHADYRKAVAGNGFGEVPQGSRVTVITGFPSLLLLVLLPGLQEAISIVASSRKYIFFIYSIYGFCICGSVRPLLCLFFVYGSFLCFGCPQYFAFATRRTGKTLYPESDGLQKPADNAFCTICGQYAVVVHGGI